MTDITTIPDEILQKDLDDSYKDVAICRISLDRGITTYRDHPEGYVQDRLEQNLYFIEVIEAEQKRRKELDGECTCNPINGTACPSCVESNKVRYLVIPIEGEI